MAKKRPSRPKPPAPRSAPSRSAPRRGWVELFGDRRVRFLAAAVVLVLILAARLIHLGIDPPLDLSWSQDLFTDPPQYTSYARNAILFDQWNPMGDDRLVFFQKNIMGLLAYVVFLFFAPSVTSGQLVAVLANMLGIAFLVFCVHRAFGFVAAWTAALLLGVHYFFVGYNRLPFLEVISNALWAGAFFAVISSARRWWWVIAGGAAAGAAAFFGKVTALHAAPILLLTAGLIGWQAKDRTKAIRWGFPIGFIGGMAFVYAFWYVIAYSSASSEVLAYLKEQTLSLYGTPVGLSSISGFYSQWFSFGLDNTRYPNSPITWGPVLGILGFAGMCGIVMRYARGNSLRGALARLSPACFAFLGWFWSAYAAFMPFNYRPGRYQVVLIYPLTALAGWLVVQFVREKKSDVCEVTESGSWIGIPFLIVILATGLQHLVMSRLFAQRIADSFYDGVMFAILLAAIASVVWFFLSRRTPGNRSGMPLGLRWFLELAVGLALVFVLVNQGRHFTNWWTLRQTSLADANRDLESILGDGAVLTGGYGTALSQGGRSGNFPAMFGVSKPDFKFFERFPVTHVVEVDQPGQPFFKNYSGIVDRSARVATYTIRNLPIVVYRVAEAGGNTQAAGYKPSAFEEKRAWSKDRHRDSVLAVLPDWVRDSADTFSGWRWLGDLYYTSGRLLEALDAYGKAVDLYGHDFLIWALIGDISWEIFRTGSSREFGDQAIEAWTRAQQLNPRNRQIAQRLKQAYRR